MLKRPPTDFSEQTQQTPQEHDVKWLYFMSITAANMLRNSITSHTVSVRNVQFRFTQHVSAASNCTETTETGILHWHPKCVHTENTNIIRVYLAIITFFNFQISSPAWRRRRRRRRNEQAINYQFTKIFYTMSHQLSFSLSHSATHLLSFLRSATHTRSPFLFARLQSISPTTRLSINK